MPKIDVLNQLGENVGSLTLNKDVFGIEPNNQAMFDAVILAQANLRQDTSKTKKRGEVSGGGIKPYRQKGTGRARQGSTRAPQWRHGGVVFGPAGTQNHDLKMNRQVRRLAIASVLSQKFNDKELVVVDKFELAAAKTKDMKVALEAVKATKKVLIVRTEETMNDNAFLGACNLNNLYGVIYFDEINAYDLMNCGNLVITKDAVKKIEEGLLNG